MKKTLTIIFTILFIFVFIVGAASVLAPRPNLPEKKQSNTPSSSVITNFVEKSITPPPTPEPPKMDKGLEDEIRRMALPKKDSETLQSTGN